MKLITYIRRLSISLGAIACVLMLSACAIVGHGQAEIGDNSRVAKIVSGKSTKTDVKSLLGEPHQIGRDDRGKETWTYTYNRMKLYLFFVTEVSLVGDELQDQEVTIEFNRRGIVQRVAKNANSASIRAGF